MSKTIKLNDFKKPEGRLTTRLITYWKSIKGIHKIPLEKDINYQEFEDIWDNCFILRVSEIKKTINYRYDYLGESIRKAYSQDFDFNNEFPFIAKKADSLHEKYLEVIRNKRPVEFQGAFITHDEQIVKFKQCIIPFSIDGNNVTTLIGAVRYKIITRKNMSDKN